MKKFIAVFEIYCKYIIWNSQNGLLKHHVWLGRCLNDISSTEEIFNIHGCSGHWSRCWYTLLRTYLCVQSLGEVPGHGDASVSFRMVNKNTLAWTFYYILSTLTHKMLWSNNWSSIKCGECSFLFRWCMMLAWLSAMATNFLGQNNFHIILHLRFGHTM